MKFFNKVLVLAAATTALAVDVTLTNSLGVDTSACEKAIEATQKSCNQNPKNMKELCEVMNDSKCNKVFKEGISSIPECKDMPLELTKMYEAIFQQLTEAAGFSCEQDEAGNYCPLSKISQEYSEKKGKVPKDEAVKAINESCESKKCREAFIGYFKKYEAISPEAKEYVGLLEAEQCIKTAETAKPAAAGPSASGASTTMKVTSAAVVMFGLLLNTLL